MPNSNPQMLTLQEAAQKANRSEKTLRTWIKNGVLTASRKISGNTSSAFQIHPLDLEVCLRSRSTPDIDIKKSTNSEDKNLEASRSLEMELLLLKQDSAHKSDLLEVERSRSQQLEVEVNKHLECIDKLTDKVEEKAKEKETAIHSLRQELESKFENEKALLTEEVKQLRRKLDQKEAAHISHIGQIASLTSQVGILKTYEEALIPFQEAYNKRVNMGAIKRLFSAAEAIPIKVDLEAKDTMLLTQGEIIETDSTVEKE